MAIYNQIEDIEPNEQMNIGLLNFLQINRYLQSQPLKCELCDDDMKINYNKNVKKDHYAYNCTRCGNYKSLRINSFFFNSNLSIPIILNIIKMLQGSVPRQFIAKQLKINKQTVTTQYIKLMKYCARYNLSHPVYYLASDTIEVDEMIEEWKDGIENGSAIFGMVGRNSGLVHIEAVRDKSSGTLIPIIKQHTQLGATIISDAWTGYKILPVHYYTHKIINKAKEGFSRTEDQTNTVIHVNRVENLWAFVRKTIEHHSHLISTHGKLIVAECMYRKNFKNFFLSITI